MNKTVPQALSDIADLYRERNRIYGDNYQHFGKVMLGLFPRGLTLNDEEAFNRFAVLIHIVTKVSRYSQSFTSGGHPDSLDDLTVYSQMLRELDAAAKGHSDEN